MVTLKPKLLSFLMALFLALIGSSRGRQLHDPPHRTPKRAARATFSHHGATAALGRKSGPLALPACRVLAVLPARRSDTLLPLAFRRHGPVPASSFALLKKIVTKGTFICIVVTIGMNTKVSSIGGPSPSQVHGQHLLTRNNGVRNERNTARRVGLLNRNSGEK
jgi:hypothetical protein